MRDITLRTKLTLAFIAVLVMMGILAGIMISELNTVTQIAQESYTHGLSSIKLLGDAISQAQFVRERLLLFHSAENSPEQLRQRERMDEHVTQLLALIDEYKLLIKTEESEKLIDNFDAAWAEYIEASDQVIQLTLSGDKDAATLVLTGEAEHRLTYALNLLLLAQDIEDNSHRDQYIESQTIFRNTRNTALGITALAIILSLGLAFWLAQTIANPMTEMAESAQAAAAGDLGQIISVANMGNDEIGILARAFNNMTTQLQDTLESLEQRIAARTKDQETVAKIATEISLIQDMQEMLARMVHLTQRGFGLYHAHVFTFHEEDQGEELRIIACGYQEGDEHEGTHGTSTIDYNKPDSIVARCARERQPIMVNDVRSSPDWLPNPLLPETRSEMAIPLLVGDKLLGVLDVQSKELDHFTNDDINIQSTLGAQIAVAMQNLTEHEEAQKIANDLSVVAEVGLATSTISESARLLQEVVDLSKKSFELYHAHIYLLNEAGDTLRLASGADDIGRQMVSEGHSIPLAGEQSLVAQAARTRQGVVVNDVTQNPHFLPNPLLPETRSELAVPMVVANKLIGVLDVQSEQEGRFTKIDINVQATLASQIAIALENVRAVENARKQAQQETTLNWITQQIQSATTIEDAMKIAARELGQALGKRQTMISINPAAFTGENKEQSNE